MTTPAPPSLPSGNGLGLGQKVIRKLGPLALVLGAGFMISEDYFEHQVKQTDAKIAAINQRQRLKELQANYGDWTGSPTLTGFNRLFQRGRIRVEAFSDRWGAILEGAWNTIVDNGPPLATALAALYFGFGKEIGGATKAIAKGISQAIAPLIPRNNNLGKAMLTSLTSTARGVTSGVVAPVATGLWKAFGPLGVLGLGALGFFGLQRFQDVSSGQQHRQDLQNDLERSIV